MMGTGRTGAVVHVRATSVVLTPALINPNNQGVNSGIGNTLGGSQPSIFGKYRKPAVVVSQKENSNIPLASPNNISS